MVCVCVREMLLLCPAAISSADPQGNINSPVQINLQLRSSLNRLVYASQTGQMLMVDIEA